VALTVITDPRCVEYSAPGHPERPARVSRAVDLLKSQDKLALSWAGPADAPDASILRAHTREHLGQLKSAREFDADTPAYPGIADHARRSVGGALAAMAVARAGNPAFSLLRPPGHHATSERAMGFCYLNSVAIAALEAQAAGFKRVAVFDFDVHHGNGTEEILLDRDGMAFFSIHQHPCYPGTGIGNRGFNCFNFPVAPATPRLDYRGVLQQAVDSLKRFKPDVVAVSAGFDAYRGDPLAQETLEAEDFHWLGETIRKLGIPAFSLLEGGYSDDLPELIFAYLRGVAGVD
jgi:acetoin utilization deacetylase AcuC-like enzyme